MDYSKRTEAIVQRMQEKAADWFFVTHLPNVRYLSGFTG
ncbi:MAG: aminopeptidase P family N-terminal domain-containing protein, partial [Candidatus Hinthialibacter sp.]